MRFPRGSIPFIYKGLLIVTVLQLLHVSLANPTNGLKARRLPEGYSNVGLPTETFSRIARGNIISSQSSWPKKKLALDPNGSCSSYTSILSTTFDVLQDMLYAAKGGLATIKASLGKAKSSLSDADRAKMDAFMAMYGIFDPTQTADINAAQDRITSILSYATRLAAGLYADNVEITIFCNDDHMVLNQALSTATGSPPIIFHCAGILANIQSAEIYNSNVVLTMVPEEFTGKCAGDSKLLAFMCATDPLTQDVMTICPGTWKMWGSGHLSTWSAKSLSDVQGQSFDKILNASPELTILHEITHTESFFQTGTTTPVMYDYSVGGLDAYAYQGCYLLGQNQVTVTDVTKNNALNNAETFSYFVAAMYLDMCNWKDGVCKDPSVAT